MQLWTESVRLEIAGWVFQLCGWDDGVNFRETLGCSRPDKVRFMFALSLPILLKTCCNFWGKEAQLLITFQKRKYSTVTKNLNFDAAMSKPSDFNNLMVVLSEAQYSSEEKEIRPRKCMGTELFTLSGTKKELKRGLPAVWVHRIPVP